jgi:hypothetical protein
MQFYDFIQDAFIVFIETVHQVHQKVVVNRQILSRQLNGFQMKDL